MKHSGYLDRAMKTKDPRYARVFGKLGYDTTALSADQAAAPAVDDIAAVREEYERVVGKRPYHAWDVAALREKIAAHQAGN